MFSFPLSVAGNGKLDSSVVRDPILESISKLQPRLKGDAKARLARALRDVSHDNECQISWKVLIAVAFNESSLWVGKVNHKTKDHGLMQINEKNILRMGLDRHRLKTDERYALSAGCRILTDFKKGYAKKFPAWVGMYRAGVNLHKPAVVLSAQKYDTMIRKTVARVEMSGVQIARMK
jgi:hypothetical protein